MVAGTARPDQVLLLALSAFNEFTSNLAQRAATPPTASDARTIGAYRGRTSVPAATGDQS